MLFCWESGQGILEVLFLYVDILAELERVKNFFLKKQDMGVVCVTFA